MMEDDRVSLPGLVSLYWNDLVVRRTANMFGFGLVIAAGMYWVNLPVEGTSPVPELQASPPNALEPIDNQFDVELAKVASLGGLALSGVGLTLLFFRWMRIRKILSEGTRIRGLVEDIEVYTNTTRDKTTGRRHSRHSYWATLRYTAFMEELTVEVRLPNSGFTYGLAKGQETDLMVHEATPKLPLICSVYLKRPAPGR